MIRIPDIIKDLFITDNVRKNFRVIFPNGEYPDIVNDKIESESVTLTESISSGSVIKFGLCESPMIEFICHGMPNFTHKTIKCQLEVDISSLSAEDIAQYGQTSADVPYPYYVIPYGTYIVKACKKSGDSDKRKVVGYSKLAYNVWAFPEDAFFLLKNYGWYEAQGQNLSLSLDEFLMLYSPNLVPEALTQMTSSELDLQASSRGSISAYNNIVKAKGYFDTPTSNPYFFRIGFKYVNVDGLSSSYKNLGYLILRLKAIYDGMALANAVADVNQYIQNNIDDDGYITVDYNGEPIIKMISLPCDYLKENKATDPSTGLPYYWRNIFDFPCDVSISRKEYSVMKNGEVSLLYRSDYNQYYNGTSDAYRHTYEMADRYFTEETEHIETNQRSVTISLPSYISIVERTSYSSSGWRYTTIYRKNLSPAPAFYQARHIVNGASNPFISFSSTSRSVRYHRYTITDPEDPHGGTDSTVNKTIYGIKASLDSYLASIGDYRYDYRDFVQSALEIQGKFGMIDRTTGDLKIVDLTDHLSLYPAPDLYPAQDLYPRGSELLITRNMYKLVEYEDSATRHYDRISCTWTDSSNNEHYQYYDIVDHDAPDYDPDDYQTYSLSENYFIKNKYYTVAQVTEILQTLGEKIKGFQYFPCDIECVGLPYVETGDGISVVTKDSGFTSFVLRRTIKGIQSLEDNIEAR